jgi:glucose/mannose-6-phosphate isomerase
LQKNQTNEKRIDSAGVYRHFSNIKTRLTRILRPPSEQVSIVFLISVKICEIHGYEFRIFILCPKGTTMNLDDLELFKQLDPEDMLWQIDNLPDQLELAWQLGNEQELPLSPEIDRVLISGMGGSAIGGDLLNAYSAPICRVPVVVNRDYTLPAWARGKNTLVIASSHSGNTEETLEVYEQAVTGDCQTLSISTGGALAARAAEAGLPAWHFEHDSQPRAALGFSFGLLMAAFTRLGLIPDPSEDIVLALEAMRAQQETLRAEVPVVNNPAKRMAGQLVGRWVAVFGSGILEPVARRLKGQISEHAKAWAQFEAIPEANHNSLAGIVNPTELFGRTMMIFLMAATNHPRNQIRGEITRSIFMLEGLNTDFIQAKGDTPLANQWTTIHFGDYTAYYLAMAYGVDPMPVAALQSLKARLKEIPS